MYNLVKKNNIKILVSLVSIMVLFWGLTFLVRRGNNSLTSRDRELMKYDQYQTGDEFVGGTDYVTFDAYFYETIGGTPTKIRGNYLNINDNAELWLDLHVFGDVTLKDAKLELVNGNVETSGYLYKNSFIPKNSKVPNGGVIELNPSIQGATFNNKITISSYLTNDLNSLSNSTNKIILTGTVVKSDGTEVSITKEVKYTVDWYLDKLDATIGKFKLESTEIPYERIRGCEGETTAGNEIYAYYHEYNGGNYELSFRLTSFANNPFLKSANVEMKIPSLNGYAPLSVRVTNADVTYNYDPTTQTLTASNESLLDGTLFTDKAYSYKHESLMYNEWNIIVEYPREVENSQATMMFSTKVWYEEYRYDNNSQIVVASSDIKEEILTAEFAKPVIRSKSDLICGEADRLIFGKNLNVGSYSSLLEIRYINKTGMLKSYNNEANAPKETSYDIYWYSYINYFDRFKTDKIATVKMSDTGADSIGNQSLAGISKYKTLYVSNAAYWLGSSGYIKIINNDTDEVIHILTALDWNTPYTFTTDVTSIRLETSEIVNIDAMQRHYDRYGWQDDHLLSLFTVSIRKEIDHNALINKYSLAEFNGMSYVSSAYYINGSRYRTESETYEAIQRQNVTSSASLRALQSAEVEVDANKTTINSTELTDVTFSIKTGNYSDIVVGYKDAEFLLVLPDWVLDFDINSISIDNSTVTIDGYEKVDLNGKKGIKILTSNDTATKYTITVNTSIIPDARQMSKAGKVEVYATNPSTNVSGKKAADIYDINNDSNTNEYQNYASKAISLSAPNEIITTTTINYKDVDDNGVIVVSPMVADVNPLEDHTDAEIEIGITNNAFYPTQDFRIIGKIGFVGNTYQIGDGELGSEFNVTMSDTGIKVPIGLESNVKIYYSDKETPTADLNNAANNWKQKNQVTDFSTIKTYMIVIDDYILPVGERMAFTYDIEMPNTTADLNKKTYFTHGVYYNIDTGNGLLDSNVGGAKLGIRISRRYDLELVNTKMGSARALNNSKYLVTAKDTQNNIIDQKILVTDGNGYGKVKNLYAGLDYEFKQISVKYPYILDEETKTINVINGANDVLSLQTTGTFKTAILTNNHLVNIEHENETRYDIVLTNTDLETGAIIPYTEFKITGKGYESGYTGVTDYDGHIYLKGLYLNELYELEQTNINNHLLTEKTSFKLVRDVDGNVKISVGKPGSFESLVNLESNIFTYEENVSRGEWWYSRAYNNGANVRTRGYIPIDLENLTEDYVLSFSTYFQLQTARNVYSTTGYLKYYLLEDLNDITNDTLPSPIIDLTPSSTTSRDHQFTISGGKKYYLYIDHFNGTTSPSYSNGFSLSKLKLSIDGGNEGDFEYVALNDTTDVATYDNPDVFQTLQDGNNQDEPILNINVKNRSIPTYTLEITKKNADSQEVLAGAQYKIMGPGLPATGKYVTTDENGKATVELYKEVYYLDGSNYLKRINGLDYSQYNVDYIIEEVVAPVGYTKDSKTFGLKVSLKLQNGSRVTWGYDNVNFQYLYNYVTDLTTETNNIFVPNLDLSGEFKEAQWDNDSNTLKVTMYDYPVIRITKKDAETGELLPNTLFAIYGVERVGSSEVLTPALDSKGEIVGDQVAINGKDYYVVATDENGQLNLDLVDGTYKIWEVKAADEKYEITSSVYYFGVGETIPYRAPGFHLVANTIPSNISRYEDVHASKIKATSDGGWIAIDRDKGNVYSGNVKSYLVKYDKDMNIEWKVDATTDFTGSAYIYYYGDDPTRERNIWYSPNLVTGNSDIYEVTELADGGFATVSSYYGIIVKYDKNGNREWQNFNSYYYAAYTYDHVCTYEGNTNAEGESLFYKYDETLNEWVPATTWEYDSSTGTSYEVPYYVKVGDPSSHDGAFATRDDDTYYCHVANYNNEEYGVYVNYFSFSRLWLEPAQNGDLLAIGTTHNSGSNYYFEFADGTWVPATGYSDVIMRYNNEGKLIAVYNLDTLLQQAEADYAQTYGVQSRYNSYSSSRFNNMDYYYDPVKSYPNGDLLFLTGVSGNEALKLHYNEQTDEFEVVYYTPIGINGYGVSYSYSISEDYTYQIFQLTDDGGFTYAPLRNYLYLSNGTTKSDYYNTPKQQLNYSFYQLENNQSVDGSYIFKFDGQGNISDITQVTSYYRNLEQDSHYLQTSYIYGFYKVLDDDSYLVGTRTGSISTDNGVKSVILANGETFYLDQNADFIIFKVSDNGIEWINQYDGDALQYTETASISEFSNDGKRLLVVMYYNGTTVSEIGTDGAVFTTKNVPNYMLFEFLDEIQAEGPESYTLNIENKRKEYKINASSNEGGEITVTNPDNGQNVTSTTGTNTLLEKVKYGDTNKYDITVVPAPTYVVAGVQVNGKDISYTVNSDGSVTLDKIPDIKEDKNITVTYAPNKSQVIVKHYMKDTTTSVFGDEILIGDENDPYETEPKQSDLYTLATDDNDEIILPSNMIGNFDDTPITVIYYYQENEVDLKVNYYVDGTDTELAPSNIQRRTLGSTYHTSPMNITNYNLSRTIGDESGTLTKNLTEVTYMYTQSTESKITIRHVDKATNQDLVTPIVKTVSMHDQYTTDDPVSIPAKYRLTGTPVNASGPAEDAEIEVIYYYEEIPFNVSVDKKINSILLNGEKQTITDSKNVTITPAKKDNLIVYYEINLKNTGDIKANFTVVEGDIPGFVIYDKGNFVKTNNGYELVASLEPGEEKTYRIGYKWNQKDYGISTNKVELKEVTNDKGFAEPDALDNISTATVETKIPTEVLGETTTIPNTLDNIPAMIGLLIASIIGIITSLILIRKRRMN